MLAALLIIFAHGKHLKVDRVKVDIVTLQFAQTPSANCPAQTLQTMGVGLRWLLLADQHRRLWARHSPRRGTA